MAGNEDFILHVISCFTPISYDSPREKPTIRDLRLNEGPLGTLNMKAFLCYEEQQKT